MEKTSQHFGKLCRLLLLMTTLAYVATAEARTWIVLTNGDSITQGLFRTFSGNQSGITSPQFGSLIGGYQPFAKSQFEAGSEDSIILFNWGFAGANSAQGISQVETALASRNADIAFINFGANDLFQGIGSTSSSFNLGIMADRAIADNVVPIVGTISPNTNTELNSGFNSVIRDSYNPKIVSMAANKFFTIPDNITTEELIEETSAVPLADLWNAMNPNWNNLNSGDGLHLNSSGNQVMASVFVNSFEDFLASLIPVPPPPPVVAPVMVPLLLDVEEP